MSIISKRKKKPTNRTQGEKIKKLTYITLNLYTTRWNSTYLMLMTTLKFQTTFGRTVEVDKPYNPYFHEEENNKQRVGLPGLED